MKTEGKRAMIQPVWLRYAYLLVFAIPFLLFAPSLTNELTYFDDDVLIINNHDKIKDISNAGQAFRTDVFMNHESPYYRPLMTLTLMLDSQFASETRILFHLTNLLLHCLCCVSLLWLLTLLGADRLTSFWWVLVYAVHPLLAHAVLWIPARSDIMVTLFSLLFFCFFIRYLKKPQISYLILNVVLFGAAMFSKESAIFLPFLALLYAYGTRYKLFRGNLLFTYMCWLLFIAVWFFMRNSAVNLRPDNQVGGASFLSNIPFPAETLLKFFIPIWLPVLPVYSWIVTIPGAFLLLLLLILLWYRRYALWPIGFLGAAWFVLFIVPNMLVRLNTAGDDFEYLNHRTYLPFAGLIIFLVSVTPEFLKRITSHLKKYIWPGIITGLALLTLVQQQKFTNAGHFWASAINDSPSRAWFYYYQGRFYAATKDYDNAEKALQTAISLKEYPRFLYELGLLYYWSGKDIEKAFTLMQTAVTEKYSEPSSLKNFAVVSSETGRIFFGKGEYKMAAERCRIALAYDSANAALYYNLGLYYMYTGENGKAPLQWRRALKLDSGMTACYKNLFLYYQSSPLSDSARFFEIGYQKRTSKR